LFFYEWNTEPAAQPPPILSSWVYIEYWLFEHPTGFTGYQPIAYAKMAGREVTDSTGKVMMEDADELMIQQLNALVQLPIAPQQQSVQSESINAMPPTPMRSPTLNGQSHANIDVQHMKQPMSDISRRTSSSFQPIIHLSQVPPALRQSTRDFPNKVGLQRAKTMLEHHI